MELGLTTANAAAGSKAEPAESDVFGIRPDTGRPHSICLQAASRDSSSHPSSRGLDLLVGLGIGAAAMYYLDPQAGPARRARLSGALAGTLAIPPDVFDEAAYEVALGASRLLAAGMQTSSSSLATGHAEWLPGAKLVAGAVGAALTFLGGRRRDALGAAVGVLGSALLTRGMSIAQRPTAVRQDGAGGFDGAVGE
jgi:hypothetical protein